MLCRGLRAMGGQEKAALLLASALRERGTVDVWTDAPAPRAALERRLGIDLGGVAIRDMRRLPRSGPSCLAARTRAYGLFVNNAPSAWLPSFARRSWLWVHCVPQSPPRHLGFYRLLANSRHTQGALRKAWGVGAGLLHPPVQEGLGPLRKEKIILLSGRLHSRPVAKNELPLLRRFARLVRAGRLRGWTLYVAGVLDGRDSGWLRRLRDGAEGLPVSLHINPPFEELARLYGRASILWHGAGAPAAARRERPAGRAARHVEHFGLAVAEAMSAGAVPLAPRAGGPRELIAHGKDGFLYATFDELAERTEALAAAPARLWRMGRAARRSARRFSLAEFRRKVRAMVLEEAR